MVRIAIHQNNFIPWLPFFYKMAMADKFILLDNVQFEKNNFQNRYKIGEKWITKSVESGMDLIRDKKYSSGRNLSKLNNDWIKVIKDTLEIETEICYPKWGSDSNPTERLIREIKLHHGDIYITNPEAKNKYLDEDLMRASGIEIEYCIVPKDLQIHVFEAFEKFGIDGTIKQLQRANAKSDPVLSVS